MTDDAILEFSQEIIAEVEESLSTEAPFSQEVFTRLILERLEEAGQSAMQPSPSTRKAMYGMPRTGSMATPMTKNERALIFFTTIYSGDLSASKISAADVTQSPRPGSAFRKRVR